MIQNQHQYQVTQNKLKDLKRGLVKLEEIQKYQDIQESLKRNRYGRIAFIR